MTIQGAMNELIMVCLDDMLNADDIPIYYKGAIKKVIETMNDYIDGKDDYIKRKTDVVSVVRCKDCKHVTTDATCCLVCGRSGMGLKPYHVYHDDFCSYGEFDKDINVRNKTEPQTERSE